MNARFPKNGTVGARTPLVDGVEKVTGKAKYTADIAAPDAMVGRITAPQPEGQTSRSPAHGSKRGK